MIKGLLAKQNASNVESSATTANTDGNDSKPAVAKVNQNIVSKTSKTTNKQNKEQATKNSFKVQDENNKDDVTLVADTKNESGPSKKKTGKISYLEKGKYFQIRKL